MHSEVHAIDEGEEIGVHDESPLYLKVEDVLFHVYQLSTKQFAVAAEAVEVFSADAFGDAQSAVHADSLSDSPHQAEASRLFSGDLLTENGEVLIRVRFRPAAQESELLICSFFELDEPAAIQVQELVELLETDWAESLTGEDAERGAGELIVTSKPAQGILLETGDGQPIYSEKERTAHSDLVGRSSAPTRYRAGKWLLAGTTCVIFLAGLLKLSLPTQTADTTPLAAASSLATASRSDTPQLETSEKTSLKPSSRQRMGNKPILGTVTRLQQSIVAEKAGYVEQIPVSIGQPVSPGDVIALLNLGQASGNARKLASELKLASVEEETRQVQLDSARRRMAAAMTELKEEIASLSAALRASEQEMEFATTRWERIKPLAEKDNVGRNEVEQVQRSLQLATERHADLKVSLAAKQEILDSNEPTSSLANKLGISLESLKAELKLAKSRVEYLREQLEIEKAGTQRVETTTNHGGNIVNIMVSIGDAVEVGQTICSVQTSETPAVVFTIQGDCRDQFDLGQIVPLRLLDSKVRITGIVEDLKIDEAAPRANEKQRSTLLTVLLAGNEQQPNMPLGTMLELESLP